jgi:arsenite-transporting ATPase
MRLVLYTGKGGVGKTSIAASHALRSAGQGLRTVILSTDSAHSLSDCFDLALGNEPRLIAPNLWGQELNIYQEIDERFYQEQRWKEAVDYLREFARWLGMEEILAEEVMVLPGVEEVSNLLYIRNYVEGVYKGSYDVIVVDCAPTGETLRLLSLPETFRWWMEKVFPFFKRTTLWSKPVLKGMSYLPLSREAKKFMKLPLPSNEVFRVGEEIFEEFRRVASLLTDPQLTSMRLVLIPEKMVIDESRRTFTYLNLYGYLVDAIILNRLIPEEGSGEYFRRWRENQEANIQKIGEYFSPLPVLSSHLLPCEVAGKEMIEVLGGEVFGELDPNQLFFEQKAQEIYKLDGYYTLSLTLPLVSRGDLSLKRDGEEIIAQVGCVRRNILLPAFLSSLEIENARLDGNSLDIKFKRRQK